MGFGGRLQGDFGTPSKHVNRFLPQGGFQSINATISAQERCRVPLPGETDVYGSGVEDTSELDGVEDALEDDDLLANKPLVQQSQEDNGNNGNKLANENGPKLATTLKIPEDDD